MTIVDRLIESIKKIKLISDEHSQSLAILENKVKTFPIKGIDGKDGKDGKDGLNGKDGIDGKNGLSGRNGKDGIDGKDGTNGNDGKNGVNGKSAYEIAQKYDYKGTEEEWLKALKGKDAENNIYGARPTRGSRGKSSYEHAKEGGYAGTEEQFNTLVAGIFPDSPSDGKQYARKDGNWAEIVGGGGGVTSFNTRTGAITPQNGDYTASMVGAVSSTGYVATDNNYTTAEKNKLSGIAEGAEVNVNADWNASSGDAQILNKPTIPTQTSQLTNNSNFIVDANYVHTDNNYTTTEKNKLAGIETSANNYVHPANHLPSIITQDTSNRFVTDTEKSTWNAKEPAITKNTAFNKNYGTTATDVKMNGTQAVGSVDAIARIDHVHPTDTSRQAALVSGTSIKTVGGNSLLGSGDIPFPSAGAITYLSNVLGADVSIAAANTWYTGATITLTAGTWLVNGMITVLRPTTTAVSYSARISDGTNHYASAGQYMPSVTTIPTTLKMTCIITVSTNTVINLQATGNQTGTIKAALTVNAAGNTATQINAIKLS